jgi:hypothetical protein
MLSVLLPAAGKWKPKKQNSSNHASGAGLTTSPLSPPRKTGPLGHCNLHAFLLQAEAARPASECRQFAKTCKTRKLLP